MNETLRATLAKLIELEGISKGDLAESVGMPYATLAGVLNGTRGASVEAWDTMLGHFGMEVSIGVRPV